jgi:amidase
MIEHLACSNRQLGVPQKENHQSNTCQWEPNMANTLPEYDQWDATEQAKLVREGKVSPAELLEAAIDRIESRNPSLNAVVLKLFERAQERVSTLPDGPFRGVPFLLKDLKAMLEGTPTSNSTLLMKNCLATASSVLVSRYEAAGMQILGKTNTPEFGIMGITEPALRGPCRNPWNHAHTPGGSSGGAASAVASRMVAVAHGGDGGGSIRIPASACGLFGLKPTRGRVSQAPFRGESWGGFVQEHVLARSVRDSAAILDISDAPVPGDPYWAPPKQRPWLEEVGAPVGKCKIAYTKDALYADSIDPECQKAVDDAVELLRELGHDVQEAKPAFDRESLVQAYFLTVASGVALFVEETAAMAGKKPNHRDFEPTTWVLAQIGWSYRASELEHARYVIQKQSRQVASFFEEYDLFLTSTLAAPPQPVGAFAPTAIQSIQLAVLRALPFKSLFSVVLETMGKTALSAVPNTQLFNQTGQPAMSVPLYWSEEGLPIGVQFAAKFGDEATLFRLAAQLEEARPWSNRPGWEQGFS